MKVKTLASAIVLGAYGLLIPIHSHAFGLGKIAVHSALNEPFKAEVPVMALRNDDSETLQVKLASAQEFAKAGIDRSYLLTQLKFEIKKKNGQTIITVTSDKPVREPFLDFLLIANTATDRLIREYTALLDPPTTVFNQTVPTSSKQEQAGTQHAQVSQKPQPATATATTTTTYTGWEGKTYQVKPNETLSSIAKKTRPDTSITIDQMMMALLRKNPRAFINQNINQLKAHVTLTIPDREEITAMSKKQARAAVLAQYKAWKRLGNQTVVTAENDKPAQTQATTSTTAETTAETTADVQQQENEAHLKLVVPSRDDAQSNMNEPALMGDKKLTKLTEQLTLAQETIESQAQENKEIKARMKLMEEQIQTLKRLISLKDSDLAKLQQTLHEGKVRQDSLSEQTAASEADMSEMPAQDMGTENASEADMSEMPAQDMGTENASEADMSEMPVQDMGTENASEADMSEMPVQDMGAENASEAQMSEMPVQGMGAENASEAHQMESQEEYYKRIIAMNRAEEGETSTPDTINEDSSTAISANSMTEQLPETSLSSQHSDQPNTASDNTFFGSILEKVQLFYQRHRLESLAAGGVALLALILLMWRRRRDAQEWEYDDEQNTADSQPEVTPETTEPVQAQVSTDTNSEDSNNTSPSQDSHDPDTSAVLAAYDTLESDLDVQEQEQSEQQDNTVPDLSDNDIAKFDEAKSSDNIDTLDVSVDIERDESKLQEDLSEGSVSKTATTDTLDDDLLQFEIPPAEDEISERQGADSAQSEDDVGMPFELDKADIDSIEEDVKPVIEDAGQPESGEKITAKPIDLAEDLDDEISLDLSEFDDIDEVETKLDLASAYIDMGDPEGARSILDEVLNEGNEDQKTRATQLLETLS